MTLLNFLFQTKIHRKENITYTSKAVLRWCHSSFLPTKENKSPFLSSKENNAPTAGSTGDLNCLFLVQKRKAIMEETYYASNSDVIDTCALWKKKLKEKKEKEEMESWRRQEGGQDRKQQRKRENNESKLRNSKCSGWSYHTSSQWVFSLKIETESLAWNQLVKSLKL